jgi:hypothetical protein
MLPAGTIQASWLPADAKRGIPALSFTQCGNSSCFHYSKSFSIMTEQLIPYVLLTFAMPLRQIIRAREELS